jgi:hypothetical protein
LVFKECQERFINLSFLREHPVAAKSMRAPNSIKLQTFFKSEILSYPLTKIQRIIVCRCVKIIIFLHKTNKNHGFTLNYKIN